MVDDKILILDAERRRQSAVVDVDLVALSELFAENLIHVHSTGLVHNKIELLEHIDRKRGFTKVERGHLDIRIEGDTAVMTGPITNHIRGRDGGAEIIMRGFVTQILYRYPDGWKFTNFQLTTFTERQMAETDR